MQQSKLPPLSEGLKTLKFAMQNINKLINPPSQLTGIKDIDRVILSHVPDKELLTVCSIDRKFWNAVCDDAFLKRRLAKYIGIEKYKGEESWKEFFLKFIYYTSRMREENKFEYTGGDFRKQYNLLKTIDMDYLFRQAVRAGELSLVIYAVNNGANLNTIGGEALSTASLEGYFDIVKYLVENGVNVENIYNPLTKAAENGHLDIVKYLVENGADIHIDRDLPLAYATENDHYDVVKYLVEKGADVIRARAIESAASNGNFLILQYLVENSNADLSNVLSKADPKFEIVKYLVEKGSNITPQYLLFAASRGTVDAVKYLLERTKDADLNTLLIRAASSGNLDVIKYLISLGADVKAQKNLSLLSAVVNGRTNTVKYLVEKGADVQTGENAALIDASKRGRYEIVKFLVESGADIEAQEGEALKQAIDNGHYTLVKFLVESGADIRLISDKRLYRVKKINYSLYKYLKSLIS